LRFHHQKQTVESHLVDIFVHQIRLKFFKI
jgi:hypothetical protein